MLVPCNEKGFRLIRVRQRSTRVFQFFMFCICICIYSVTFCHLAVTVTFLVTFSSVHDSVWCGRNYYRR